MSKTHINKSIKNEIIQIFSNNHDLPAINLHDISTSIIVLNR